MRFIWRMMPQKLILTVIEHAFMTFYWSLYSTCTGADIRLSHPKNILVKLLGSPVDKGHDPLTSLQHK